MFQYMLRSRKHVLPTSGNRAKVRKATFIRWSQNYYYNLYVSIS